MLHCRFRWQKNPCALEVYLPARKAGDTQCDVIYMIIYVCVCVLGWRQALKESRNEASWIILWPEKTSQARIFLKRSEEGREGGTEAYQKEGRARTKNKCWLFRCTVLGVGMDTVERKHISYCCCSEYVPRRNEGRQSWPQLTVWGFSLAWWEKAALSLRGRTWDCWSYRIHSQETGRWMLVISIK